MSLPYHLTEAFNYLDIWLKHQHLQNPLTPGLVVAISHEGKIVYQKALGLANRETGEEMTTEHLFRIASQSKSFTATAVMQLAEAGKLRLDDPVSEHLPFLKENPDKRMSKITVRQVLSHSAGIIRDGDARYWSLKCDFPDKNTLITLLKTEPLVIEHNTRFKYSNVGYALLGLLIEAVSGHGYDDYIQEHIFKPLRLENIGTDYDPQAGAYAHGHSNIAPQARQIVVKPDLKADALRPAAGFFANAHDLCMFFSALIPGTEKLLSDESKKEMIRRQWSIPAAASPRAMGSGLMTTEHEGKAKQTGHGGVMPCHMTNTLFSSEKGVCVSVMTNGYMGLSDPLTRGIWHIIDFFFENAREDNTSNLYAGCYYDLSGGWYFVPLKDALVVSNPENPFPFTTFDRLEKTGEDTFYLAETPGTGPHGEKVRFRRAGSMIERVFWGNLELLPLEQYLEHFNKLERKSHA